jgi:hypothetical protein
LHGCVDETHESEALGGAVELTITNEEEVNKQASNHLLN